MRSVQYYFSEAILDGGLEGEVAVELSGSVQPQRLMLVGYMAEIRGHFKIKRSRLPLLDREDVIAYSTVARRRAKRRTTVEYRGISGKHFVRAYLPESVVYIPLDPLSYVTLDRVLLDESPAMPPLAVGAPATIFGPTIVGMGVTWSSCSRIIKRALRNHGDVRVRVFACIFGVSLAEPAATCRD